MTPQTNAVGDPYTLETPDHPDDDLADLDFDQTQDEDATVAALAAALQPRFRILGRSLAVEFPDRRRLKLPLDLPYDQVMAAVNGADDTQAGQLSAVLDLIGADDQNNTLQTQGFIAVQAVAAKFFQVWGRLAAVTPGESNGSKI
ncbi:MAG: hypothetical protein LBK42_13760 [Propionibacteriaceae bacterium]|jgi:hypothetical protein|nr:hypothetical protein [Propionibacteriaceae bacterium]